MTSVCVRHSSKHLYLINGRSACDRTRARLRRFYRATRENRATHGTKGKGNHRVSLSLSFDEFRKFLSRVCCHGDASRGRPSQRGSKKHTPTVAEAREKPPRVGTWLQVCLAATGGGPLLRTNGSVSSPLSISFYPPPRPWPFPRFFTTRGNASRRVAYYTQTP